MGWWQRGREGMRTPLHRFNNDMVFVDGRLLKSASWEGELDGDSFYVDYEAGHVYIGADPANRTVEITAFDNAFIRVSRPVHGKESDKKGPTLRGITFTQYAYRAIDIEGKKPATLVSEEPTDDPVGPAEPGTLRPRGGGHDARERRRSRSARASPATSAGTGSSCATR